MASSAEESSLRRCETHPNVFCKRIREPPGYYCYKCSRQAFEHELPASNPAPEYDPAILRRVTVKNVLRFNRSVENSRARSASMISSRSFGSIFRDIFGRSSYQQGMNEYFIVECSNDVLAKLPSPPISLRETDMVTWEDAIENLDVGHTRARKHVFNGSRSFPRRRYSDFIQRIFGVPETLISAV